MRHWWERSSRLLPTAEIFPDKSVRTGWWWGALAAAAIVSAVIGLVLISMPLQMYDMLSNIVLVHESSWADIFPGERERRLGLWVTLKFFYEIADGHYFVTFKALHVVMVFASLLLAARLMNAATAIDFAAVTISLFVLVGMHTFVGLIDEGFPINNHLTVVLASLASANLAYSRGGILADVLAVALFVVAVTTVETGVLVPVILIAAYLLGYRGVSLTAIVVTLILLVAFLVRTFFQFGDAGQMINLGSGVGLSHYEPKQLIEMFSGHLYLLFLYNIGCAILSVIFSEPQQGLWIFTRDLLSDNLLFYQIAEVGSSALLAALVGWYVVRRRQAWYARRLDHSDRLVLLGFVVVVANAAVSFAYLKSVTLGTAGAFWALAGYAVIREVLRSAANPNVKLANALAVTLVVALLSLGFVVRTASAGVKMYAQAVASQSDWVTLPWNQPSYLPRTAEGRRLVDQLRNEALRMPVPPKESMPRWLLLLEAR